MRYQHGYNHDHKHKTTSINYESRGVASPKLVGGGS